MSETDDRRPTATRTLFALPTRPGGRDGHGRLDFTLVQADGERMREWLAMMEDVKRFKSEWEGRGRSDLYRVQAWDWSPYPYTIDVVEGREDARVMETVAFEAQADRTVATRHGVCPDRLWDEAERLEYANLNVHEDAVYWEFALKHEHTHFTTARLYRDQIERAIRLDEVWAAGACEQAEALARLCEEDPEGAIELLDDLARWVRARGGWPETMERLEASTVRPLLEHPSAEVRQAAITRLGNEAFTSVDLEGADLEGADLEGADVEREAAERGPSR